MVKLLIIAFATKLQNVGIAIIIIIITISSFHTTIHTRFCCCFTGINFMFNVSRSTQRKIHSTVCVHVWLRYEPYVRAQLLYNFFSVTLSFAFSISYFLLLFILVFLLILPWFGLHCVCIQPNEFYNLYNTEKSII